VGYPADVVRLPRNIGGMKERSMGSYFMSSAAEKEAIQAFD